MCSILKTNKYYSPQSYWISLSSGNCVFILLIRGCKKVHTGNKASSTTFIFCLSVMILDEEGWCKWSITGGAATGCTTNTNLKKIMFL